MWNINDGPVTRYGHCPPSHHFRGWGGRTETNITFPQSENLRSFETLLEPFAFNNKHSFLSIWDDLRMTSKCSDLLIKCGINGNISWLYLPQVAIFLTIWVAPNTLHVSPCNSEQTFSDMVVLYGQIVTTSRAVLVEWRPCVVTVTAWYRRLLSAQWD